MPFIARFDSSPIDVHDAKQLMQHHFQFSLFVYYEERRGKIKKSNVQLCVRSVHTEFKRYNYCGDFVQTNNIFLKRLTFPLCSDK